MISLLVCRGVLLSSILRVFRRFMFLWPGDKTEDSATFFTPITSRGSCPFALNLLLILERTDAFPGLSLDPVLVQPRPEVCPRTQRKAERRGRKRGRERERMRQGVRGMEQIKNRCLYTCDSAFQNGAETEPSGCGAQPFLPLSPLCTFSASYWT